MDFNTRVTVRNLQSLLAARGLETNGAVQRYIDNEVLRLSDQYEPFQSGSLKQSGITGTKVGSGNVIWNIPYARFLYYGKAMVGANGSTWAKYGEQKHLTNRNLNYHGAPQRGSYWFERMKAAHLNEILQGAARVAGGRARR